MSDEILEKYNKLIESENVMTVSVFSDGTIWSAPVYYIYEKKIFYFISSKKSEHIKIAKINPLVSVSVYKKETSWKDLKGIQMRGIQKETRIIDIPVILGKYLKRYPFTKDLFDVDRFLDSLKGSFGIYEFWPEKIVYTDNSVDFGFKREIAPI